VAEQLGRLAGLDLRVEVEAVDGAPDGLGWRTRMSFAVDADGGIGLRRHRSHDIEHVERCPIAVDAINDASVGSVSWRGARQLEIVASPGGGPPVARVETGRQRLAELPDVDVGLVWKGRTLRAPDHVEFAVDGLRFAVGPGVFWQVHPSAGPVLTQVVLDGLDPQAGERVVDLYAGAGLFTVALARVVGRAGVVVAVERSGPAVADLQRNAAGLAQVEIIRSDVTPALVSRRLGRPDLVVLDPARPGTGPAVMAALVALDPPPRRVAYVSCEPAPFARDLAVALEAGWSLRSLRAFDLFPMTEHVELVGILEPPGA
jgi:tRNA/tmRNA/rRNA uracil-C5-methylase (TrmA/RlmC/RlmD family)